MRRKTIAHAVSLAGLLALGACSKGSTSESAPTTSNNTTTTQATADNAATSSSVGEAKAREMFKTRCATCHGNEGKGNGPGSITLNPKPRNYTDKAWQAAVTDEQIKKTIVYGGAAVGKSPIMPSSPDLDSKPEVVDGLVKIIRGYGKP